MNILMINYEYPPTGGGSSNETYFTSKALLKKNNNIFVLTSAYSGLKGIAKEEGVKVYRIKSLRMRKDRSNIFETFIFLISSILNIGDIIKNEKIDKVIVFFSLPCGPIALYAKGKFNIDYIVRLQGGDVPGNKKGVDFLHFLLAPIRRNVLKNAIKILANSNGLKRRCERADSFVSEVVYGGIDAEIFCGAGKKNEEIFTFIYVGRLHKEKNLINLIKQISVLKKLTTKKFIVKFIGDGPQAKALKKLAEKLEVKNLISWEGWICKDELIREYKSADCLINPSLCEGLPNVILEAMACELPVIASDIEGNNELIVNNENGILFKLSEPKKLSEAMLYLLENKEKSVVIGKKARKFVVDNFSWDKTAEKYIALLKME